MNIKVLVFFVAMMMVLSLLTLTANDEKHDCLLIIYGSRYGSTVQNAKWIAEGIEEKAEVKSVMDVGDLSNYNHIILGSGIYNGQLHKDMASFLAEKKDAIKNKVIALFVTCGAPAPHNQQYLDMFAEKCGIKPATMKAFGGWQKKELLSKEDHKALTDYYKSVNRPFENYDSTDKEVCLKWAKEVSKAIKKGCKHHHLKKE
jgi:menaquinone-dependent protoporphyrinogen oxidase